MNKQFLTRIIATTVEVAIHTILYVRRIYPAELFKRKKRWDAPVYQSRHPDLNKYISGAVKAVGLEVIRVSAYKLGVGGVS